MQVDQPPPEKKPKLEDDVVDLASSTAPSKQEEVGGAKPVVLSKQEEVGGAKPAAPHKQEEVGGVKVAEEEEEEGLPAIKKSHLNLDDIPMELLPTHQERIMKQVSYSVCVCVYYSVCIQLLTLGAHARGLR